MNLDIKQMHASDSTNTPWSSRMRYFVHVDVCIAEATNCQHFTHVNICMYACMHACMDGWM